MRCPNDQTEMEKGKLFAHGNKWSTNELLTVNLVLGGETVYAWRCPKCGKIELYTEEKK